MSKARKSKSRSSNLTKRLNKLEKFVNQTVENKVMDQVIDNHTPQNVDTAGYRTLAFFRPDGSGTQDDERIGNKVTLLSQTWRMEILAPASGVTTENFSRVRLLIVENVDFTGASDLDLTDVLEYGSWALYGRSIFTSPYKTKGSNNKRYRVHFDKVIDLNQYDKGYKQFTYRKGYGNKNQRGKILEFSGPLATIPDNHRMVLFAISDSAVANHPQIMWNCRSIYKDA